MPTVRRTSPWNRKPPIAVGLNYGHPWAPFFDCVIPCSEGTGLVATELINNAALTFNGSGGVTWPSSGVPGSTTAPSITSSGYWTIQGPGLYTTEQYSISFWGYFGDVSNATSAVVLGTGTYSNNGWYLQVGNPSDGGLTYATNAAGGNVNFSTASGLTLTTGAWYHIVIISTGGTSPAVSFVVNGIAYTGTSASANNLPVVSTNPLNINQYPGGGHQQNLTVDGFLFLKGYTLTAADAASLYQNPWQIFQPARGEWLFPSVGVAPTYMPWIYGDQIQECGV
jgi:Concanavalin A-like lectin/glucanases superfamily